MNHSLVIINNEKLDVIGFGNDFSLDRVESYLIRPSKPDGKAPFFYPMHGFPNMSNGPEDCILIDNVIKTRTHKCNKLYGIVRYSKDVVRLMQRGPVEIYGQFVIENTELTDLDIVVDNEVKIYGLFGADRIELDKFLNKSAGQLITYPDDCLPSCDGVTVDNIDTVVLRKINCSVINGELTVKNINFASNDSTARSKLDKLRVFLSKIEVINGRFEFYNNSGVKNMSIMPELRRIENFYTLGLLLTTILLGSFAFLGYGVAFFMYHTSEKRRIRNRVVTTKSIHGVAATPQEPPTPQQETSAEKTTPK
ncbi:hypothetical protein Q1695_004610 [Nippostrongylus brasiliensis]|nr:hypothetical protein Q1695_004610 [Nippostrongylus brasiliensis]